LSFCLIEIKPVREPVLAYNYEFFCGQVRAALPALERLVFSNDEEVLTDGTNDKIQAVIEAGVCGRLVQLLM